MVITTLAHHIDMALLKEAYRRTQKDRAVGIDGQTAEEYAENLGENLKSLLERFKSGRYKAPPVRRVYIPKADGRRKRAIGIPTFEEKVLQRAVAMVLEAVYEQDFYECSYGFRPGRSAHEALEALWQALMNINGGWVLEVDIKDFSHLGSPQTSCDPRPKGARRRYTSGNREMAEGRGYRRRTALSIRAGDTARWGSFAASGEYIPERSHGPMV